MNLLWYRALLYGVAASIEHKKSLRGYKFHTVIDVGANRGQFALIARYLFPLARIISFEPLQSATDKYRKIFKDDENVLLIHSAIANEEGKKEIHISKMEDSSSLLPITMPL